MWPMCKSVFVNKLPKKTERQLVFQCVPHYTFVFKSALTDLKDFEATGIGILRFNTQQKLQWYMPVVALLNKVVNSNSIIYPSIAVALCFLACQSLYSDFSLDFN